MSVVIRMDVKNQMKFSVIVPVYNCRDTLTKSIESIVGQTCRDLEIILVDDGSSDRSSEICGRYAAEDPRVRVIRMIC